MKTGKETASQNYVQDLTQYNRCPIASIDEKFFRDKGLIGFMQDQKGDCNWYCKKWKFYSNQEFIRHLDEKQDCFLHYLVLKYMESIYKEEMKGLSRHIPFGGKKIKKSKDTSTPDQSIFNIDILVLTR